MLRTASSALEYHPKVKTQQSRKSESEDRMLYVLGHKGHVDNHSGIIIAPYIVKDRVLRKSQMYQILSNLW
ncbi:hypothetical protein RRG08_050871 [Elysia crispata]|uniref:Uncharacterized protein n=1 Tax=Elysia crispata TaxID=231223 RepID=A0AAE0ZEJ7_9GAST|nr:hypothetical protein RRG08_050871 [Elysia crispata]